MRRLIALSLLLGALLWSSCSSRAPGDTQQGNVAPKQATSSIGALEERFASATTPLEKLRLATQLAQVSADRQKYVDYLISQAATALTAREQIVRSLQRKNETTSVAEYRPSDRSVWADTAAISSKPASLSSAERTRTVHVYGSTRTNPTDSTPADPYAMAAIMALSMTGASNGDTLMRALDSGSDEIACEAALGLAKLKRREAIPKIINVALASNDRFSYAQALVYFGDSVADKAAKELLHNDELLHELQTTARERHYDPYLKAQ